MLMPPIQPGKRVRQRATAFILRLQPVTALLVLHQADIPGYYLPGGGIKLNEAPFDAVCREVREETGLDPAALHLVRQWDVFSYYKAEYDFNNERHDFLFTAPPDLPNSWQFVTVSDDDDNGIVLNFLWITPAQIADMHREFHSTLTPEQFPEFFA